MKQWLSGQGAHFQLWKWRGPDWNSCIHCLAMALRYPKLAALWNVVSLSSLTLGRQAAQLITLPKSANGRKYAIFRKSRMTPSALRGWPLLFHVDTPRRLWVGYVTANGMVQPTPARRLVEGESLALGSLVTRPRAHRDTWHVRSSESIVLTTNVMPTNVDTCKQKSLTAAWVIFIVIQLRAFYTKSYLRGDTSLNNL